MEVFFFFFPSCLPLSFCFSFFLSFFLQIGSGRERPAKEEFFEKFFHFEYVTEAFTLSHGSFRRCRYWFFHLTFKKWRSQLRFGRAQEMFEKFACRKKNATSKVSLSNQDVLLGTNLVLPKIL